MRVFLKPINSASNVDEMDDIEISLEGLAVEPDEEDVEERRAYELGRDQDTADFMENVAKSMSDKFTVTPSQYEEGRSSVTKVSPVRHEFVSRLMTN